MRIESVAIAGLGLIGGSIAHDLSRRGVRVRGWDADARSVAAALDAGVIESALGPALEGVEAADVFLLALPVLAACDVLRTAAPRLADVRLITDTGSTKQSLLRGAEHLGLAPRFVGAHPLAGDHRAGWSAARAGLLAGAPVYLCAAPAATPDARALAESLWLSLGCRPVPMDAGEHDGRMAWISHLPQALSSALALVLHDRGFAHADLGPGGRDMTRLAASNTEVWSQILRDNRHHTTLALEAVERALAQLRSSIEADADVALRSTLARAATFAAQNR